MLIKDKKRGLTEFEMMLAAVRNWTLSLRDFKQNADISFPHSKELSQHAEEINLTLTCEKLVFGINKEAFAGINVLKM